MLAIYSKLFFTRLDIILNIDLAINLKNLIISLILNNIISLSFIYYCQSKILLKKDK